MKKHGQGSAAAGARRATGAAVGGRFSARRAVARLNPVMRCGPTRPHPDVAGRGRRWAEIHQHARRPM